MAKQWMQDAKKQGQSVERTGMIVKLVCIGIFIAAAFGAYSFLSMIQSESSRLAPVVSPTE